MKIKIKQTTRTGTETEKQISHGRLSAEKGKRKNGGKCTENKKHK